MANNGSFEHLLFLFGLRKNLLNKHTKNARRSTFLFCILFVAFCSIYYFALDYHSQVLVYMCSRQTRKNHRFEAFYIVNVCFLYVKTCMFQGHCSTSGMHTHTRCSTEGSMTPLGLGQGTEGAFLAQAASCL